jgi:hypothetical protein
MYGEIELMQQRSSTSHCGTTRTRVVSVAVTLCMLSFNQ